MHSFWYDHGARTVYSEILRLLWGNRLEAGICDRTSSARCWYTGLPSEKAKGSVRDCGRFVLLAKVLSNVTESTDFVANSFYGAVRWSFMGTKGH